MLPAKHGQHIGIMSLSVAASASSCALSHFLFQINNFWRDVSISFKSYRRVKHHLIQAKF